MADPAPARTAGSLEIALRSGYSKVALEQHVEEVVKPAAVEAPAAAAVSVEPAGVGLSLDLPVAR